MQEYDLHAGEETSGIRLDLFVSEHARLNNLGLSRTRAQELIRNGKISVNGLKGAKPNYKIKAGDRVHIVIEDQPDNALIAENIALDIVYEDTDIVVINKQSGLVVHPAPGNLSHTLVNALRYHVKNLSDVNAARPGIVHRLDKETSGLLVAAKNNHAHLELARQFAEHSIYRRYIALVKGRLDFDEDVIEAPIGRHPYKRKSMSAGLGKNVKYAKTVYRTLKRSDDYSLVELEPFTGRTHQLRVHLASIGHPVLGDTKYGRDNEFPRLALHAKTLGFLHPATKKYIEFSSDTPREFSEFMNKGK